MSVTTAADEIKYEIPRRINTAIHKVIRKLNKIKDRY